MQQEITSVVFSFIKPEFIGETVGVYQEAVDNYEKLKGCRGIQLFRKINHLNEFMIISKWRSLNERDKYLKSEYHRKAIDKLNGYRECDPIMNNFVSCTVK
ncbi:MAG: antibiotic biosynthesis monooxygenase [Candidatus Electrothrix sp. AR4]|nr:antibiotic biosynthesis monooxygenase [Candidatus Electrothrix sp. AR4]